jgi:hypothetical protein
MSRYQEVIRFGYGGRGKRACKPLWYRALMWRRKQEQTRACKARR